MLEFFKKIFTPQTDNEQLKIEELEEDETVNLKIAICTLFVEIAKADDNFSDVERAKINSTLNEMFGIENEEIENLIKQVEKNIKESDSIYEYTSLINKIYSNTEKFELLKTLWRMIYLDQDLNMYEEHLVKKIGGLLNVDHQTIITAKLLVKEELDK